MRHRGNYYFYRCYNPVPAPADAQPIAMVEFRSGGGGDGQPEVILIFVKQSGGLGLFLNCQFFSCHVFFAIKSCFLEGNEIL